ncbi:MAG: metallophosphoesterase family protein [Candidatus Zixiibacteriota bacterium]
MKALQIAVISDVHGNTWALHEVLRDIQRRGIESIVNLGDCVYGPLDPAGTAEILMSLNIPTVCGNEDRIIYQDHGVEHSNPTLDFVRSQLNAKNLRWLESLPKTTVAFESFFLCHGTPENDQQYLLTEVNETGTSSTKPDKLKRLTASITQPVILCGHDHKPAVVNLLPDTIIVNPGSVGLQAYDDDHPLFHVIENETPHARYGIVTSREGAWRAENVAVDYDWDKAASMAAKNGRPDWAAWLRTGLAATG